MMAILEPNSYEESVEGLGMEFEIWDGHLKSEILGRNETGCCTIGHHFINSKRIDFSGERPNFRENKR